MVAPAPPSPIRLEQVPREALLGVGLAMTLWTTNIFFVRHADDILAFTTWRMIFAIPVLVVTAGMLRIRTPEVAAPPREPLTPAVRLSVLAIGLLFCLSALVNFVAIKETTLVNVGVIHSLQPAVVALVAGRYLGEIVDWKLLARATVAIGGAFLVAAASTGQGTWSLHGDLLAVLGLSMNCVWFLAGRWIRTRTDIDATSYMLAIFASGACAFVVVSIVVGRDLTVDRSTFFYAAMTALLGTVGHTIVAWAHRYVPAAVSSLFLLSQPVLIAVLAWIAFSESLSPLHVVGGVVVLLSLGRIVTHTRTEPPTVPPGDLPDARAE